jgi:RNA polymerase sigma-70 factor (ECF subfamily)
LRKEQAETGKAALFNLLANHLTGTSESRPYADLASQLGVSEAVIKMTVHRLRKRYGELLRMEVAQTVLTPGEIDEEMRHLLKVLGPR